MLAGIGGKSLSSRGRPFNVHGYIFKASSRAFSYASYAEWFSDILLAPIKKKRLKLLGNVKVYKKTPKAKSTALAHNFLCLKKASSCLKEDWL